MSAKYLKGTIIAICLFRMLLLVHPLTHSKGGTSPSPLADDPQAVLLGEKVNRIARGLLPFQFTVDSAGGAPTQMSLVDLVYCGADNSSRAKVLAIGHPGPLPPKGIRVLTKNDCKVTLASIAQKALNAEGAPDWVAASYLTVTWMPWELKLSVADAATAVKSTATTQPPTDLKSQLQNGGQPFKVLRTSDFQMTIEGGLQAYNLALQFIDENIFIVVVPSAQVPSFDLQAFLAMDTSLVKITSSDNTNLVVKLPYGFTTDLLKTELKDKEFVLQKSASGAPTVTVRGLGISGAGDTFTMTGRVKDIPGNFEANATINWQGQDLKLTSINLDAILDSCNGLQPVPKAKCILGLKAKATLFAGALTNRYKDSPLRPVGPSKPIPLQLEAKRYNLRPVVLRSQSTLPAIIFYLNFILEAA